MSTTIICTHCGKVLKTTKQIAAGTVLRCPHCQEQIRYQGSTAELANHQSTSPVTASTPRSPSRPPPLPRQVAPSAADAEPEKAGGGWIKFLAFCALLLGLVAGGAYLVRDRLPGLNKLLARSDKKDIEPNQKDVERAKPVDKDWDNLFVEAEAPAGVEPEVAEANPAENPAAEEAPPAADEPERVRPKRFASKGPKDMLQDPLGNKILDVEFSPDNRVLATFDVAGLATLWDVKTSKAIDLTPAHWGGGANSDNGRHVAFSADGKTLVIGMSHHVAVFDLPSLRIRWQKWGTAQDGPLMMNSTAGTVALFELVPETSADYVLNVYDVATGKARLKIPELAGSTLALSPDNKRLAFPDSSGEKIRLFDLQSGKELPAIQGVTDATGMVFTEDSRILVLPGSGNRQLWDVSDPGRPKLAHRDTTGGDPYRSLLSPDSKTLVSLPAIWDMNQRRERAKLPSTGRAVAFSPDSKRLAYWGTNNVSEVVVSDVATGATLTVLNTGKIEESFDRVPTCAAFSSDGQQVAIGSEDGMVVLRTISGSTPTRGSPSATESSAPSEVATLKFATPNNLKEVFQNNSPPLDFANDVWFSADGKWLFTQGTFLTAWDLSQHRQHMVLTLNDGRGKVENDIDPALAKTRTFGFAGNSAPSPANTRGGMLHADGKKFTVSCRNGIFEYDLAAGTHRSDAKGPHCRAIKSAPDGKVAAIWFERRVASDPSRNHLELVILDARDGKVRKSLGEFKLNVRVDPYDALAFSSDGRLLAAVGTRGSSAQEQVLIWEWESGHEIPTTATLPLARLEFVEGAGGLATIQGNSGFTRPTVSIFDVDTGARRDELDLASGHTGRVQGIAFAPVQPLFVTADEHGMILLRDLKTGDPRVRFKGHDAAITAVRFAADGQQFATAAKDRTVKLWNVSNLLDSK